jgi:hypothetical protein
MDKARAYACVVPSDRTNKLPLNPWMYNERTNFSHAMRVASAAALVRYSIAGNFLGLPAITVPVCAHS